MEDILPWKYSTTQKKERREKVFSYYDKNFHCLFLFFPNSLIPFLHFSVLQNSPQYDQCVVDVSVVVPFDMVVEHIVSFEETRQLSLLMDLDQESSSEQVDQVQSMDCMDY